MNNQLVETQQELELILCSYNSSSDSSQPFKKISKFLKNSLT